jgi:hypothetical protein
MITIFTTFKDVTTAVQNAVRSWLNLSGEIQVILFTELSHLGELTNERLVVCNRFPKDTNGLPFLNALFEMASEMSQFPIICYCNADIILQRPFVTLLSMLKSEKPFLAISQRTDVPISAKIDFSNFQEIESINLLATSRGKIHPPYGSDIFVFPRYQYDQKNMPKIVVGRPGWDNWMIYDARKRFNRLIDLRSAGTILHQDHQAAYSSTNPQHQVNYQYLPPGHWYTFVMSYCNYYFNGNKIKRDIYVPPRSKNLQKEISIRLRWEAEFCRGTAYYWFYQFLLIYNLKIGKLISRFISLKNKQWT